MRRLKKLTAVLLVATLLVGVLGVNAFAADEDWVVNWVNDSYAVNVSGDTVTIALGGYADPAYNYDGYSDTISDFPGYFPNLLDSNGDRIVTSEQYAFVILDFMKMFDYLGITSGEKIQVVQKNPMFKVAALNFGSEISGGTKTKEYLYDPNDAEFFIAIQPGDTVTLEATAVPMPALLQSTPQTLTVKIKANFSTTPITTTSSGSGGYTAYSNPSSGIVRTEATLTSNSGAGGSSGESVPGSLSNPVSFSGSGALSITSNVAPWMFIDAALSGPVGFASDALTFGKGVSVVGGQLVIDEELLKTLPKGEYTLKITYANHLLSYYFVVA